MSLPGVIWIKNLNGTFRGICINHCNNNVKYLLESFYSTPEKVNELINLGDISELGAYVNPPKGKEKEHSYNHPTKNVTVAYCRDRNEEKNILETSSSIDAFGESQDFDNFTYLFDEKTNRWFVGNSINDLNIQL